MSRSHASRPREALLLAALGIVGFATAAALLGGGPDNAEALSFGDVDSAAATAEPRCNESPRRLEATRTAEPLAPSIESPEVPPADVAADDDEEPSDSEPGEMILVSGTVAIVDGGGPVSFAAIEVLDDEERVAMHAADGVGRFDCRVPEGCTLRVTAPGCDTQAAFVPWRAHEPERVVAIELARAGTVTGRLVVPQGLDASEATLSVDVEAIVRGEWPACVERRAARDGAFQIDDVPLGALFVVEASVAGRALGRSLPLRMPDAAGAAVTTAIELRARASIRGVVTYEDGAPATGWLVSLRRVDDGEEFDDDVSVEDDGRFWFDDLPAGDFEAVPRFAGGDLVPSEWIARVRLDPGGAREVRLTVARGLPIAGTLIRGRPGPAGSGCYAPPPEFLIVERGDELRRSLPLYRNDGGRFRFEQVPAGVWRLRFGDDSLDVRAGATDVVLQESVPATICGTVRSIDGSTPDARIGLLVGDELRSFVRGGSFRLLHEGADDATIVVAAPGMRSLRVDGLAAPSGGELDLGELRLEPAPLLRCRIVDHAGRPVEDACVLSFSDCGPRRGPWNELDAISLHGTDRADSAGCFTLPIDARSDVLWIDTPEGGLGVEAAQIEPAAGDSPRTIRLPPPRRIRGKVTAADGRPVPGVEVSVQRPRPWLVVGAGDSSSAATDDDGAFEITVLAGGTWNLDVAGDVIGAGRAARALTLEGAELDVGTLVLPW